MANIDKTMKKTKNDLKLSEVISKKNVIPTIASPNVIIVNSSNLSTKWGKLTILLSKSPFKKNGKNAMANLTSTYNYCIYEFESPSRKDYYSYGVMTYMYVDIPLLNDTFKIPVYSKTDTYYRFHIQ